MNEFLSKIGNLKEVTKKLNKNKKKILNKNVCNSTLKWFLVNASTINFKGTYSKLFWNPCVQIERLENWLPNYVVKTNNPKRKNETRKLELKSKEKRIQKPLIQKLKVTKKVFESLKGCYVFMWGHSKNSIGTYTKSVETELWDYVKINMSWM